VSRLPVKPVSIGRAGLEPALLALSEVEFDGAGGVQFGGMIRGARSLVELGAVRDQLLGLDSNRDEPVVPVVCAADASLDGFYRVGGVRVTNDPTGRLSTGSVLPWSVSLEKVAGSASPVFDTRLLHAVRSGSAVTSASSDPLHGVPPTTTVYRRGSTGLGSLTARSTADGGNVYVNVWAGNDSQANAEWQAEPDGYYRGACRIARMVGGAGYRIVGKQIGGDVDPDNGWAMSNGLVSVLPSVALGGTVGTVTVLSWAGAAFESATALSFSVAAAASFFTGFSGWSILRNSPEATTVRLRGEGTGHSPTLDLTLRRGDRNVLGVLSVPAATDLYVTGPTVATTGITGAARLTSNDSDGNRFVLSSALGTVTAGGSAPIIDRTSTTVVDFGIAHEINGSSSTGIDTAQALANQYAAYVSERVTAANP